MARGLFLPACVLCVALVTAAAAPAAKKDDPNWVCRHNKQECKLVNRWYRQGTAAGNIGDYYDNRDRGHSQLKVAVFPQISEVAYSDEQRKNRLDWGGQTRILKHVTIGNSSTSSGVKRFGSNVRAMYYVSQQGMRFLYTQYRANNLYVYPEHRDHDPERVGQFGHGDLFPTNSPYVVISQGSSGSDGRFLKAFVHTLAAFRPEVKQRLIETGLLMPTLQLIFRNSYKPVNGPGDYVSGVAHPTVFEGTKVNAVKMVKAAHAMRLDTIPPMVQLRVVEEDSATDQNPFFQNKSSEKLADTLAVIARIFRGPAYWRRIVVHARESFDINSRPLTYHWAVLRGDDKRIHIKPLGKGDWAEIMVAYHPHRPVTTGSALESSRVDIGVFVHNGVSYSAPGFITFYMLDNELRTYGQQERLVEIHYGASDLKLEITNWQMLLKAITGPPERLPQHLLRQAFDPVERAAIDQLANHLQPALARLADAKSRHQAEKTDHQYTRNVQKSQIKKFKDAHATHKEYPNPETKAALDQANAERAEAVNEQKSATHGLKLAREGEQDTQEAVDKILSARQPELRNQTLEQRIQEALKGMKDDLGFYVNHADGLHAWLETASAPDTSKFLAARQRLVKLKILEQTDEHHFALRSVRPSDLDGAVQPTGYERHQLQRFHAVILTDLLYPGALKIRESRNFLDPRLAKPQSYRDLFHYDANGKPIGRTRIHDDGRVEKTGQAR